MNGRHIPIDWYLALPDDAFKAALDPLLTDRGFETLRQAQTKTNEELIRIKKVERLEAMVTELTALLELLKR